MDPDDTLDKIRRLIRDLFDGTDDPVTLAHDIATLVSDLDEHLSNVGDLPEEWDRSN